MDRFSGKYILLALLLVLTLSGCGPSVPPGGDITISGKTIAAVNGATELIAKSTGEGSFYWSATAGSFDTTTSGKVVWKAPGVAGTYKITVTKGKATKEIHITVKETPLIISNRVLVNDGIGGKDIEISFFNNSAKTVTDIKVEIYMWNGFGERVSYLGAPTFKGIAPNVIIAPGNTRTFRWGLFLATGVSRVIPYVFQVAYSDGSVWSLY